MANGQEQPTGLARQRIDKWLFFARLKKSRSLAAKAVESGDVAVNGQQIRQPSYGLKAGDVVVVSADRHDIVVKVLSGGVRRGPYEEARLLYEDMTPPPPPKGERNLFAEVTRDRGAGRPTKRERRQIDRLQDGTDD
ncbi:RNA-binding S4 domain-containing protein [Sinorhizobium sp. BG8]|uniref:RNA-binding S4 domain-containing protein n=1 Tax=Sinorhizobium sp. BG8 TaxID=2613773 RepID=UPI00193DB8C4|nr:RNA-binding S4 domain-containing protein [Sinorhizobium sp. BG8]QRM53496.1 RNA-binding S4 domain-containing protein [Sinorhizobium sp. BG8]